MSTARFTSATVTSSISAAIRRAVSGSSDANSRASTMLSRFGFSMLLLIRRVRDRELVVSRLVERCMHHQVALLLGGDRRRRLHLDRSLGIRGPVAHLAHRAAEVGAAVDPD